METLNQFLSGAAVAPWEIIGFVGSVGLYIYLGRRKSALQVTFIFTFYWGFKNLMAFLSRSATGSEGLVFLYVGCGLAIFALMSANYLMQKAKNNLQPIED